jgi:hypothetical protein
MMDVSSGFVSTNNNTQFLQLFFVACQLHLSPAIEPHELDFNFHSGLALTMVLKLSKTRSQTFKTCGWSTRKFAALFMFALHG